MSIVMTAPFLYSMVNIRLSPFSADQHNLLPFNHAFEPTILSMNWQVIELFKLTLGEVPIRNL